MSTKIEDIDFKALAKECKSQEDLAGLTKQFMKNMIEGMLQAELEEHLEENGGSKNGTYPKTVRSDTIGFFNTPFSADSIYLSSSIKQAPLVNVCGN